MGNPGKEKTYGVCSQRRLPRPIIMCATPSLAPLWKTSGSDYLRRVTRWKH